MNRRHPLPPAVYTLADRTPHAVLLEGHWAVAEDAESLLFLAPERILRAVNPAELPILFAGLDRALAEGRFAAGYLTYECGQAFEPAANLRNAAPGHPLAWFGVYPRAYRFNHATGTFLDGEPPGLAGPPAEGVDAPPAVSPGIAEGLYSECIAAIHNWIRSGDVYQLNFTFPLRLQLAGSAAALYARLRHAQPARFGAFLHSGNGHRILSFSPELFFRIDDDGTDRRITTRPMKGTSRRGRTTAEDACIAEELRNDPKNRAENVMIVDLLRNDLGRLCEFGTVRVEDLFAVERHPTLWQMTSTVSGLLRTGTSPAEIFRALFPSGSVTGAPKVRAMQLLAQLEDEPRGVYTGAIGYFSPQRTVFNVAIRTLELRHNQARMGIGSGIVIDSRAEDEFRECRLKADFLTRPRPSFSLVETLLWQQGYPLLPLHLDRLADSAAYFDFPCHRDAVQSALLDASRSFAVPQKVRLLLRADGSLHIEPEPISAMHANPGRVCFAAELVDPADPFCFHKTTHRPLYAQAFHRVQAAGYSDVLFLNLHGEVTEGAISNLFIEKDGRWFTPPVACGLLPGVYRRHLLQTRPEIEERVLSARDLITADAVYLANAVRGLRRVVLDGDDNPLRL